jgi:hypothetical protein
MFRFKPKSYPFILLLLLCFQVVIAQVPQKFNYQGIARDAKGNPLGEKQLALKISVLPTADATVADYVETQQVSTNEFGLYTLQIGGGTPLLGDMKTVKWETGNKYIQVAIDPLGGTQYEVVGTTQLLSVPYAIYADKAGQARETVGSTGTTRAGNVSTSAAGTGTVNYLTKFVAANTIYNSQIFDNGTNVGIGTTTPSSRLHISTTGGNQEHLRMENLNPAAWGKFIFYNNNAVDYHTFTKYGTGIGGNYGGLTGFPYASLMVFGSNTAPTMVANANNIGFSLNYGSVAKLKYYAHHATGNVGIGGNATPAANVHFNSTDYTGDTLKITNTTSGHTATDGLDIRMSALAASVINRENSTLAFGTNNVERARIDATGNMGIGTITPTAKLEVAGQVKITGGVPGAGKVLTSDAAGLASWQNPTGGGSYTAGTGINITGSTISNTGDLSNTNEIQTLSIAGSNLSLSNGGGTVALPTGSASYVAGTGISITGSTIANTGDLSNTNEIQTLSIAGSTLSLSNGGGSITLPSGGITGSGTVNYIPKFTPNGTTLGNSRLRENTAGDFGFNIDPQPSYVGYYKSSSASNVYGYSGTNNGTIIQVMDSGFNSRGMAMNRIGSTSSDSDMVVVQLPTVNYAYIGSNSGKGLSIDMNRSSLSNTFSANPAALTIETIFDTAAHFYTTSSNYTPEGIIRSEYLGNSLLDRIGVEGRVKPSTTSYGIGIAGTGGYTGVIGTSESAEDWFNFGVLGSSAARGTSYGVQGIGTSDANAPTGLSAYGDKFGVYGSANGGERNYGVYGFVSDTNLSVGTMGVASSIGSSTSFGLYGEASGNGINYGSYNYSNSSNAGNNAGSYSRSDYSGTGNSYYTYGSISEALSDNQDSYGSQGLANVTGSGFARGLYGEGVTNTGTATGVYGIATASNPANAFAGYFNGKIYATSGTFGTKPFTIDHPLDPAHKILRHSSIESPDMMNIYNGNITTDANGYATVTLPDYFSALNEDFKYQLTVIGVFAQAIIKEEISNNQFKIQTNQPNVKVSWQVSGVRHDAVAKKYPIIVEETKSEQMQGKYFEPEAFGLSSDLGIMSTAAKKQELHSRTAVTTQAAKERLRLQEEKNKIAARQAEQQARKRTSAETSSRTEPLLKMKK